MASVMVVSWVGYGCCGDPFEATPLPATPPRHMPGAPRADQLAFGHGMHYCSRAALARLEKVALLDLVG